MLSEQERQRLLAQLSGAVSPVPLRATGPVQVLYGGAHLFSSGFVSKIGGLAVHAMERYLPDEHAAASVFGLPSELAVAVRDRVKRKLESAPLEDYRIDFEDGYGARGDDDESKDALRAGAELRAAADAGLLPSRIGFRIKALSGDTARRAVATFESFMEALGAPVPSGFVVTLPKVEEVREVEALVRLVERAEEATGSTRGSILIEIVMETPHAIRGSSAVELLRAAGGRCAGLHLGPYDYLSSLGIASPGHRLDHPACVHARQILLLAAASEGTAVADGPVTFLPIAPHPNAPAGSAEDSVNHRTVHAAWGESYRQVRRALDEGVYRGWDLHPAQLVSRYAATYAYFLEGLESASGRLRRFLDEGARASRVGASFDDEATARGLLQYFRLGYGCGALDDVDLAAAGVTSAELGARSGAELLQRRNFK